MILEKVLFIKRKTLFNRWHIYYVNIYIVLLYPKLNSFGMDLVSLNIQRGRDHGLPTYAELFSHCHGTELLSFSDLIYTPYNVKTSLQGVYEWAFYDHFLFPCILLPSRTREAPVNNEYIIKRSLFCRIWALILLKESVSQYRHHFSFSLVIFLKWKNEVRKM